MSDHPDLFPFPEISDEAVIAVNHFLEAFYTHFQNHYFAQMHRYYADLPDPARTNDPGPLLLAIVVLKLHWIGRVEVAG